ncbi:uncharacterized protein I303_108487 [Kwoniella dejecticola CBS 10117]|uniref:BRCT domain-containing protein n=1 Tax=Kwoniella dejecticola CBS 10117 TaxID=1296121 RepID=A0A1A5ZX99_9TREE|nr:uncharacterized protein I303_07191 [Kwoniella dejecticola CBS 10117]OBR82431.1 hypothetical protein I303_07191 [Kwoniella dejecticola CBS 10117]
MTLKSDPGPSKLSIHPSRLEQFSNNNNNNNNDFNPTYISGNPRPRANNGSASIPLDSGANSVPLRDKIRKRRVPVWTLPLKPLSRTAQAKKKAEKKRKADFYGGNRSPRAERKKATARARAAAIRRAEKIIEEREKRKNENSGTADADDPDRRDTSNDHAESSTTAAPKLSRSDTGPDHNTKKRKAGDKGKEREGNGKKRKKSKRSSSNIRDRNGQANLMSNGVRQLCPLELQAVQAEEKALNAAIQPSTSGSNAQNAVTIQPTPGPPTDSLVVVPAIADAVQEQTEDLPEPHIMNEQIRNHTMELTGSSDERVLPRQVEAGPSRRRTHHVQYPVGGESYDTDGDGIFVRPESEEAIDIWVDVALPDNMALIKKVEAEGGQISSEHTDEATQLIILHPASTYLFDMYCHPDWLRPRARERYRARQAQSGTVDELWQKKVLLKSHWVDKCLEAGKFLGHDDEWGGCRAGGPPVGILMSTEPPGAVQEETSGEGDQAANGDGESHDQSENVESPGDVPEPDQGESGGPDRIPPSDDNIVVDDASLPVIAEARSAPTAVGDVYEVIDIPTAETDILPTPITAASQTFPKHFKAISLSQLPSVQPADIPAIDSLDEATEILCGEVADPPSQAGPSSSAQNAPAQDAFANPLNDAGPSDFLQNAPAHDTIAEEEKPDPALQKTMFSGLKFWVDTTYPDRIPLIRRIKGAGGELVTSYPESTHVLIHNYKNHQWHSIVEGLSKQGIWSVNMSWISKSLDQGRRLHEFDFAVPHGVPLSDRKTAKKEEEKPAPEDDDNAEEIEEIPPEKMAGMFEREDKMTRKGGTKQSLAAFMASKYGVYSETDWLKLYKQWIRKKGRFKYLSTKAEAESSVPSSPVVPAPASRETSSSQPSPKKARLTGPALTTEELVRIFTEELPKQGTKNNTEFGIYMNQKYPAYSAISWTAHASQFRTGKGRFANIPMDPSISKSNVKVALPSPIPEVPSNKKAYTDEELVQIFSTPEVKQAGSKSFNTLGKDLAAKYGVYHVTTWAVLYSEWTRKTGRFKPAANGGTPSDPTNYSTPLEAPLASQAIRRGSSTSASTKASSSSSSKAAAALLSEDDEAEGGSLTTEEKAVIFKEREAEFTDRKLSSIEIGLVLKTEVGIYARATWRLQWTAWWRKEGEYASLPERLQSTIAAKAYADQQLPFRGGKPGSKSGSPSSPAIADKRSVSPLKRPKKIQERIPYTMEEEKKMAQYIARYRGSTPKAPSAWNAFAATYPARTAGAYSQHYREYQYRIDTYKPEIDADAIGSMDVTSHNVSGSQSRPVEVGSEDEHGDTPIMVIDDDDNNVISID